ncbi:MAG: glycosyltransferase [Thermoplasmata archaeon]|nr:glycosyltransferase [Thermoplasmata archaeon]
MIDLCLSTQTPPVRPLPGRHPVGRRPWKLGRDYASNVGGVIPMMRALLRVGRGSWIHPSPLWVSMGGAGIPAELVTDEGYRLETVQLPAKSQESYREFKEAIWRSFHGPAEFVPPWNDYPGFVAYNHATAQVLLRHADEFDLFYVNDFQQILVGGLVGTAAPALLRWHIPLDFRGYPAPVRHFFLKSMEGFDAIVVSTRTGLEELIDAGFQGRAFQVYPYFDPHDYPHPSANDVEAFRARYGLQPEDRVLLTVGRLDPVKRQDLLLRTIRPLRRRYPTLKLLLVGGGSFSTQGRHGAASKSVVWHRQLEEIIRSERIGDAVISTGEVSPAELRCAYGAAEIFVHPAPWEGFGLVAAEAWHFGRPVVVSAEAGVAELVDDGVNGYRFRTGDVRVLTQRIRQMLDHPSQLEQMGAAGRITARRCYVQAAAPRLRYIFEKAIEAYAVPGLRRHRSGARY